MFSGGAKRRFGILSCWAPVSPELEGAVVSAPRCPPILSHTCVCVPPLPTASDPQNGAELCWPQAGSRGDRAPQLLVLLLLWPCWHCPLLWGWGQLLCPGRERKERKKANRKRKETKGKEGEEKIKRWEEKRKRREIKEGKKKGKEETEEKKE